MAAPATAHEKSIHVVKIIGKIDEVTDPEYFKISKGQHEQVHWVSDPAVYFNVEFKGDSPFYESQFSTDSPYSGLVRRSVLGDPGKQYEYRVRIKTRNGEVKEFDPGGVVNP